MAKGCDFQKKSFTVQGDGNDFKLSVMSDSDREALNKQMSQALEPLITPAKKKRIIPYGDRILVKRQRIGEKLGSGILHSAQDTAERPTEIAEVVYIPDHSFTDKSLIENSEQIIDALTTKCKSGDSEALISLIRFNEYLRLKTIQVGEKLMISRYAGTDFMIQETGQSLTIIDGDGIIGLILEV